MNKYFLFAFFISSNFCFAQVEYNYVYNGISAQIAPYYYSEVPEGVNSINIVTEKFKSGLFGLGGTKTSSFKNTYDDSGLVLTSNMLIDGNFQLTMKNEYNTDGKLVFQELYKKNGKLQSTTKIKRNDDNEYLEYTFLKGNDNLQYVKTWTYNEEGKIKESKHFKGKNKKLKKKWVYEYYEDGQRKTSRLFNGKGKLKQVWTYECKEEGEELSPKKDVKQICKYEESDGNFLLKVTESLNEKGKRYKSVHKYNSADTSLVKAKYYNDKNELYSMGTYDGSVRKPLSFISYRNEEALYKWIYKYENDRLVYRSTTFKNKTTKTEYEYIDNNLIALKSYNKNGELAKTTTYKYN